MLTSLSVGEQKPECSWATSATRVIAQLARIRKSDPKISLVNLDVPFGGEPQFSAGIFRPERTLRAARECLGPTDDGFRGLHAPVHQFLRNLFMRLTLMIVLWFGLSLSAQAQQRWYGRYVFEMTGVNITETRSEEVREFLDVTRDGGQIVAVFSALR